MPTLAKRNVEATKRRRKTPRSHLKAKRHKRRQGTINTPTARRDK